MDKKKAFIVFIAAAILAFVAVFVTLKKETKENELNNIPAQTEVTNTSVNEELLPQNTESIEVMPNEQSQDAAEAKQTNKVTKTSPANKASTQTPAIKPLQVQSVFKESVVLEEEEKIDPGIYRDPVTGEIVVTKEFKTKSYNRYSVKDLGRIEKVETK